MEITKDQSELKLEILANTLKLAILQANELECFCEDGFTCGKHSLVSKIVSIENEVEEILSTY